MAPYIPPHRRPALAQQTEDARLHDPRSQGRPPQSLTHARPAPPSGANDTTDSTPVWRRGAAAGTGPVGSGAARTPFRAIRPSGPGLSIADSVGSDVPHPLCFAAATATTRPARRVQQIADEIHRYISFERFCLTRQPKPIKAEECEEDKEYAQWAGGYVEVNDKLLSEICPCNLVGKPCPFDELEDSCPMIRLCGQLEKWTIHKCPDRGFRTILDAAENVPADYGEKGFGAVNYYDSSDESGGVALDSSPNSETESPGANVTDLEPNYNGKKVSFNDFSCGVKNGCGHIHWEVEINCRFVGWFHYKNIPCKQVLDKGRLCSVGHDLESARQSARDAVAAHERSAVRVGVPQARDTEKRWVC